MRNLKTKVIPILMGATGTTSKTLRKYQNKDEESAKSRNYRKKPQWVLHMYFGKY
jgi:hypothetical protein